jgi:hypothetical protein
LSRRTHCCPSRRMWPEVRRLARMSP